MKMLLNVLIEQLLASKAHPGSSLTKGDVRGLSHEF